MISESGEFVPAALTSAGPANAKNKWNNWVIEADRNIRNRLEQGDEDSIVNLLLFGTSFTRQPRLTEAEMSKVATQLQMEASQLFNRTLESRLGDFVRAVSLPNPPERLAFAKAHLQRKVKTDLAAARGKAAAKNFLLALTKRMFEESAGYASLIEQAKNRGDDVFVVRSQMFSRRGLSSDTSLKPNLAIEKALIDLKVRGKLPNAQRVAIIGPGLDFTDKDNGYDFYPPQTIQPFAIIESLLKLGLTNTTGIAVDTYDLSPKVNSHILNITERAKRKQTYTILLPFDSDRKYTPEFIAYWQNFGGQIATVSQPTTQQAGVQTRSISVKTKFLSKIRAFDTNIVLQSPVLADAAKYDLIIGTNIFLYYDSFQQGLAMLNLNKMLKPGGILLSNNALIEHDFTPIRSIGYTSTIYSDKPGDADAIIWYQKQK